MPAPAASLPHLRALCLALGILAAGPALAHHPVGGAMPTTLVEGLLSGLGHPVIGLDHLAALIGVGLVSARFAGGLALPLAWIAAMAAGVGLHLAAVSLPFAGALVALAVIAIGLAAALRPTLPAGLAAVLFAAGGLFHGHALAEAIVGAETTPVVAYLAGLVAVQAALTTGLTLAVQRSTRPTGGALPARLRLAGFAVMAAGAAAFAAPVLG
jgi:urease accessory protein